MLLKKLGAPASLWEEAINRSNKYKHGDCSRRWSSLNPQLFPIGSLFVLAKEGYAEMLERIEPTLNMNAASSLTTRCTTTPRSMPPPSPPQPRAIR